MPEKTKVAVSVSLDLENREGIDKLAARLDRDRSYLVNEAVGRFIARMRWEEEHIKEGLRQAKAGKYAAARQLGLPVQRQLPLPV